MKKLVYLVLTAAFAASFVACATPDSVKLQGDKIERLQRQLDEANHQIEKLQQELKQK